MFLESTKILPGEVLVIHTVLTFLSEPVTSPDMQNPQPKTNNQVMLTYCCCRATARVIFSPASPSVRSQRQPDNKQVKVFHFAGYLYFGIRIPVRPTYFHQSAISRKPFSLIKNQNRLMCRPV